ncbi:MAG: DUF2459 domain-containing protein [Bacteroidota bacterium]
MSNSNKWKRLGRLVVKLVGSFLFAILLYLGIACILSVMATRPASVACHHQQTIFLSSNGIHLDLVLPRTLLEESMLTALSIPKQVEYIAFGWGDRGFYLETPTWKDLKWNTAINALFLQSESVMHVTHYRRVSDSWRSLAICEQQMVVLLDFIWTSFKQNEKQMLFKIGTDGYTKRDFFYEAKGSYSLLKTCNNWVNIGLKKAQVKTAIWSPFDWGILYHLEK